MNLDEAKSAVEQVEASLDASPFVVAHTFVRDGRALDLALTGRLRRACKRGRVWKSKGFLTAFKNAGYGFDPRKAHSPGGSDGIFVLTREHRPVNAMMKKLFDRYMDRADSGVEELCAALGTEAAQLVPVRLVSHHLRLLGVLWRSADRDRLVLVDYDDSE